MLEKVEGGLQSAGSAIKNFWKKRPALVGATTGAVAVAVTIGTGGLALIPMVGVAAAGAGLSSALARDSKELDAAKVSGDGTPK